MLSIRKSWLALLGACTVAIVVAIPPAHAQQTTGALGSPNATTTIDGKYLPPPPAPFGGTINLDAKDSRPYWPPTVVPPKGAPNILLIMTDDQGYGVSGTFGGVISEQDDPAHRSVRRDDLRDFRCRSGYPHRSGRQRLAAAVPVLRQDRQTNGRAGPPESCGGKGAPAKGPGDQKQST